jgi:hypothetical protein
VAVGFSIGGFLVSLALLASIRTRFFPASSPALLPWFAVLLGLGNACAVMLRRPLFYEAAIACAYGCVALALAAILRAVTARPGRWRAGWLAVAGLALGLAVGSRVTYVFGSGAVLVTLAWLRRRGLRWREVVAALAPLAACAAALLAYNYARFGNVLEFGVKYQFATQPNLDAAAVRPLLPGAGSLFPGLSWFQRNFDASFVWHNLRLYYFSFPGFSWYFPFITPVLELTRPPGYGGVEFLHGQVWATFWLIPAACALVVGRRAPSAGRTGLAGFVLAAAWVAGATLAVVLSTGGRAARYLVDFQPTLLLLGAVAFLGCEVSPGFPRAARLPARLAMGVAVVLLGLQNVFASLQFYELFRAVEPAAYARLARIMNRPSAWAGRWLEPRQGPITLQVTFPPGRGGELETLVATGSANYNDTLMVHYLGDDLLRFVLQHHGYGATVGEPVRFVPGRPHELAVDLGSLYPRAAVAMLKRRVRVKLDGAVVFDVRHDLYDASPGAVHLGVNPVSPQLWPKRFSGSITAVQRRGLPPWAPPRSGPLLMDVVFPATGGTRVPEPLVVTGTTGRADAVFVRYEADGRIRLGYDHWGVSARLSEPVKIDPAVPHAVEIWMGSLLSPEDDPALARLTAAQRTALRGLVRVKLDGVEVLREPAAFHPTGPDAVRVGANPVGMSSSGPAFSGRIIGYERLPPDGDPAAWPEPPSAGPIRFGLRLPSGLAGQTEPLLSTGRRGQGDLVAIEYLAGNRVRFVVDHWGSPLSVSEPLAVDFTAEHQLEIDHAGLYPDPETPGTTTAMRAGKAAAGGGVRLTWDGREIMRVPRRAFASAPEEVVVGRNAIGATTAAASFTGTITWDRRPLLERPAIPPEPGAGR